MKNFKFKIDKSFREQLKKYIDMKKVSIAAVARNANINHQTLYNYLQGKSDMGTDNLNKVLGALDRM